MRLCGIFADQPGGLDFQVDMVSEGRVKSGFLQKLETAWNVLLKEGFSGLSKKLSAFARYHLRDKWRFVYLEFPLDQPVTSFPMKEPLVVRVATPEDMDRIEAELFPCLTGEMVYEKRYFDLLGQEGVKCFIAEKNGRLVHYSWVFLDAASSPLVDTPFDKRQFHEGDAYVGPIFTNPSSRGFVYPHVLPRIQQYLKQRDRTKRLLVLVQGMNPAAVSFYMRMGFKQIGDAHPSYFRRLIS